MTRETAQPEYLWDGSGPADPEIAALESALRPARYQPRPLVLPAPSSEDHRPQPMAAVARATDAWNSQRAFAVAAALVMAVVSVLLARVAGGGASGWMVEALAGRPRVEQRAVADRARVARGEWLETDAASRARLTLAGLGKVTVQPGSRVRVVEDSRSRARLELPRGTIHAVINAPPRVFYVDTPSALAIDLGCEYTLAVLEGGGSTLAVEKGVVRLEGSGKFADVPYGHECTTRAGIGPGMPLAKDAPPQLRDAVEAYEYGKVTAVDYALNHARRRDGVTLWHLLQRTEGDGRVKVFERLVGFTPLPDGATREGVLALDEVMLDLWWDQIIYGD